MGVCMESMTSPNSEPPRHSREFDLGYRGDEEKPSTGPIPAAEPDYSLLGAADETHVPPPALDEAEQSSNAVDLQPLERDAPGTSDVQANAATDEDGAGEPLAPATAEDRPQEPVWPAARLGEDSGPQGGSEPVSPPTAAGHHSWELTTPHIQIAAPSIPPAPQRESARRAADAHPHYQARPGTPPNPGMYPQPRPHLPPAPPQGPPAPVPGPPPGGFPPRGGPPPPNAPGFERNAVAPPTGWGTGQLPPPPGPPPAQFSRDPYPPNIPAGAPSMGPLNQPGPPQPQHGPPIGASPTSRHAAVVESMTQLDSAPGRTRMSEAQWSDELVRAKRPRPETGWRAALYKSSFHLINPGRSKKEKEMAEWIAAIQSPLRGRFKIGVINARGGIGKTTVATGAANGFAAHRKEDRTIVVDADPGYGTAADRIDPTASGSLLTVVDSGSRNMLGSDDQIRAHVGANNLGVMVLAGDTRLTQRPQLTPETYRQAMPHVEKFHRVIFVDCGPTIDHPVMPEVLASVDALIVVSSTKADGAKGAGVTLDWLSENGYHDLLKRTIVVINDLKGNSAKKARLKLQERFGHEVDDVFVLPFDKHLDAATVIDFNNGLKPKTRRKFVEIAASIANNFASTTDLSHD